ncbi:MAG: prepilin-type cleavage/methylation domain-containing protein [Methylocystis sp.]|nr:MAG: prepilin-type cleavage/methylation domain-containing protein [Methylocystis sp.]
MKRRAPNGFTLLELLLAVSILSLITGSILGGVSLGRRTWETTRASEALDEVESAVRVVSGLIRRAYAIEPNPAAASDATMLFQGAPDAARFVALSEGAAQWGGLILTEIASDGVEIAVWTCVYRNEEGLSPARPDMKKTVVLRSVVAFELAFFGRPDGERPAVWSARWTNAEALPSLVSIKIGAHRLGRVIEASATVALRQQ